MASRYRGAQRDRRDTFQGAAKKTVTPLTIISSTTVLQWCRADLGITLNAGGVSAWADQSPGVKNYSQVTAAFQPVYAASDASFNGLSTMTFDGSNDRLDSALALTPPYWLWWISKTIVWGAGAPVIADVTADAARIFMTGASPTIFQRNGVSANSSNGATLGSWYRGRSLFANTVADNLKLGATAIATGTAAGANAGTGLRIAGDAFGAFGNVAMREILVCANEPTAGEMTALQNYAVAQLAGLLV